MSSDTESLEAFVKEIYDNPMQSLTMSLRVPEGYAEVKNIDSNKDVGNMMDYIKSLRGYPKFSPGKLEYGTLHASMHYGSKNIAYADQYSLNEALSRISGAIQETQYAETKP